MKKQNYHKDFKMLFCKETDPIKDFRMEKTGHYLLIRINQIETTIEVAIVNPEHEILKGFSGKTPRDIYTAFVLYEEQNNLNWIQDKIHLAYLGKELERAYRALQANTAYIQE